MKKLRYFLNLIPFFLWVTILCTFISCQRSLPLQFNATGSMETTVITLQISEDQYRKIKGQPTEKFYLNDPQMSIAEHHLKVDDIHLRGSSSMLFRRKSYSVSLKEPFVFLSGKKMDKFFLVSMCMDRSYYENVFAFQCLELLNISKLYYEYAEVWINGHPEGVYLIVQRPNDYAIDDQGSPYVLRRGAFERIDDEKSHDDTSKEEAAKYKGAYKQITLMATDLKGEALYNAWSKLFDVDNYFRLLSFFYWVQNGDYSDELYFYISPDNHPPRFHILPWDFDDIFALEPHEGIDEKNNLIGNKMLFSGESELDRIIATDPFLYQTYLKTLKKVMEEIEEQDLQIILEHIYTALYPYYLKPEVIEMSKYDQARLTSLERLNEDLNRSYQQMIQRKQDTLRQLEKVIK